MPPCARRKLKERDETDDDHEQAKRDLGPEMVCCDDKRNVKISGLKMV